MSVKGKLQGVDKLLRQLERFGKEGVKVAHAELEDAVRFIGSEAIKNAPANFGKLRQSIVPEKITPLQWNVVVQVPYAGYVEFGTGAKVEVPKEMKAVAEAIRNNPKGSFDDALDSIKEWCHAKGIDERAAYPILVSILNEGLTPRPYLYPAYVKGRKFLEKNLENAVDDLTKRFNNER